MPELDPASRLPGFGAYRMEMLKTFLEEAGFDVRVRSPGPAPVPVQCGEDCRPGMIRIASFLKPGSGWSRQAFGLGRALRSHERTQIVDWDGKRESRLRSGRDDLLLRLARDSAAIGIGAVERTCGFPSRYRIAFSVGETTRVPGALRFHLQRADMVWTPSHWGAQVLAANGLPEDRIRVVPEGVDADLFSPAAGTAKGDGVFRFLCVAKWEERKGTRELVRAFAREFRAAEPVELVMHCGSPDSRAVDFRAEIARHAADARIVASHPAPLEDLLALMRRCDAFVLPTRGEAWGLPVLEAMACGLPCIVTDYSGVREFARDENCFLIRVKRLIRVADPEFYPPPFDWGEWADPDWDHLQERMRFVYENRQAARLKAQQARKDARDRWSWAAAARSAIAAVRELRSR